MKKTSLKILIALLIVVKIMNPITAQELGEFVDERDGQKYETIVISGKTWMAENLNYNMPASMLYYGKTEFASIEWWNDSIDYGNKYGRLYTYKNALNVCPQGWHLPSQDEWNMIDNVAGGRPSGAAKLKSTKGWKNNGNGTNSVGLNVLPAGSYNKHNEEFFGLTIISGFWTSTLAPSDYKGKALYRSLSYSKDRISSNFLTFKNGLSVRCVKD